MKVLFQASRSYLIVVLLFTYSCTQNPEAIFRYTPAENPESGEYIYFTNESLDAVYYYWDFGNGESSEEEHPRTKFSTPGDYTVTLVAENKRRTDSISQTIIVKPPTILEIYFYNYNIYSNRIIPIQMATVQVWNHYDDANRGKSPVGMLNTNREGRVTFTNMEPQRYFVYMEKDTVGGKYAGGDGIGPIEQNKINSLYAFVNFHSDKKSTFNTPSMIEGAGGFIRKDQQEILFIEEH